MSEFRRRLMMAAGEKEMLNYLCFTALEDGTFTLTIPSVIGTNVLSYMEYSIDGGSTWVHTDNSGSAVTITTPTILSGNSVMWRGIGSRLATYTHDNYACRFSSTGKFNASGEVLSLLHGGSINPSYSAQDYEFWSLFKGSYVVDASDMSISTLTVPRQSCARMFENCIYLTKTPKILLTSLGGIGSHEYMYSGCTSLTDAEVPDVSALTQGCFQYMFKGCTSLESTDELPSTTLASDCYSHMFEGCTSLTKSSILPASILYSNCYNSMYKSCSNLVTAGDIYGSTMANNCCDGMFASCTSLLETPTMEIQVTAQSCCSNMFSSCSNLHTNNIKLSATTLSTSCYYFMFYSTKLEITPELPSLTLVQNCYCYMFNRSKANYCKMLATDISASGALGSWLWGCPDVSTSIFVKHIDATWTGNVPSNWTIIYYDPALDKYYTDQTRSQECDDHGNPI